MTNLCAQIALWPAPRGGFSVADAHAIKVCGCHTDWNGPMNARPEDDIQLTPAISQACGTIRDSQVFRE